MQHFASFSDDVIPSRVCRDLLLVDQTKLADVVNTYVGETAKNLVRLVDVADAFDSVLLLDEADSLFGRRTDEDGSS